VTLNDEGTYKAYDLENPSLIAALYRVQVVTGEYLKKKIKLKKNPPIDFGPKMQF
jgi:hypothetical protein